MQYKRTTFVENFGLLGADHCIIFCWMLRSRKVLTFLGDFPRLSIKRLCSCLYVYHRLVSVICCLSSFHPLMLHIPIKHRSGAFFLTSYKSVVSCQFAVVYSVPFLFLLMNTSSQLLHKIRGSIFWSSIQTLRSHTRPNWNPDQESAVWGVGIDSIFGESNRGWTKTSICVSQARPALR